jgi:hypothetical protein
MHQMSAQLVILEKFYEVLIWALCKVEVGIVRCRLRLARGLWDLQLFYICLWNNEYYNIIHCSIYFCADFHHILNITSHQTLPVVTGLPDYNDYSLDIVYNSY